ncbi:MAG: RIP metalloprotease RseP [Lachnospiraceae bacterium]
MKWLIAFLIFSLLILFHEFGHFIVAKLNGVEVEEFSMGFGPRLLSGRFRGTRYSLKLLLFGGSCQMKGMYDDLEEEEEDGPPKEPEKGSFQSVSLGRRAAIIFAGPFFNFLLSFICAVIILSVIGYDPALVTKVTDGTPAAEAGLKAGDEIVNFMGNGVSIARDVDSWFTFNDLKEGETVTLKVKREGETIDIQYTPAVVTRYMMGISYMADENPCKLNAVDEKSPVYAAGLRAGDTITEIDGIKIRTGKALNEYFTARPMDGSEVSLTYTRNGEEKTITFVPYESRQVQLGFQYNLGRVKTDALGVLRYGVTEIRYWIVTTLRSIAAMFTGRFSINDLSGPVGIVDVVGTTYESVKEEGALMTWLNMLNLIVLLSANLGVMNLLPIPALDGGRLLFFLVEAIIRRPINKKIEVGIQVVAVVLLAALAIYVLFHDITRIIGR